MSEPESIGIRELRQHASRYVDMAEQGQRVPVTKRGKLVAYLVPAEEPTSAFERLVAAGQVRRRNGVPLLDGLLPIPPDEPGEKPLSQIVLEMRDEEKY